MLLNRVVVGSCVESATYALLNDAYYLDTCILGPLFYEQIDFRFLGHTRKDKHRSRTLLMLSMQGKLLSYPAGLKVKIVDNQVKISHDTDVLKYEFGLCEIFDTTLVTFENPVTSTKPTRFKVYDDFELSQLGAKHDFLKGKAIHPPGPAFKINFYTSDRVDGASYVTDCIVESLLTKDQIDHVDYSDSMIRFYVKRHLEDIGIKGTFVEFYKSGEAKYRKPKITHTRRISVPFDENTYEDSENVKFKRISLKEVFDDLGT